MERIESEFITEELKQKLIKLLREIKDFPKPGIKFQDISTLLVDPQGLKLSMDALACHFKNKKIDKIAGIKFFIQKRRESLLISNFKRI